MNILQLAKTVLLFTKPPQEGVGSKCHGSYETSLMAAVMKKDFESFEFLLSKKDVDVNQLDDFGESPAVFVMKYMQDDIAKFMLPLIETKKLDVNHQVEKGLTIGLLAAYNGNLNVIQSLLNHYEIDLNYQTTQKESLLFAAIQSQNTKLVKYLLEKKGLDLTLLNKKKISPYMVAMQGKSYEIAMSILQKLLQNNKGLMTHAIHECLKIGIEQNSFCVAQQLIDMPDFDINYQDEDGQTIFMHAVKLFHPDSCENVEEFQESIKLLISKNPDVNLVDADGFNVAMHTLNAARFRFAQPAIQWLIECIFSIDKLNYNHVNCKKENLLSLCSTISDDAETACLLNKYIQLIVDNMDFSIANIHKIPNSSLLGLAAVGYLAKLRVMLTKKRLSINVKNDYGDTALSIAVENGHTDFALQLLQHEKINVNTRTEYNTALIAACQNGNEVIVRELMKFEKLSVNARDDEGDTALLVAAQYNHTEIVKILLSRKDVNVNAVSESPHDYGGYCAVTHAIENNNLSMFQYIIAREDINLDPHGICDYAPILYIAVRSGNHEIIQKILQYSELDINIECSNEEQTAIDLALSTGDKEIVKLLLSREDLDLTNISEEHDKLLKAILSETLK